MSERARAKRACERRLVIVLYSIREEHSDREERSDKLKVFCFNGERRYTAVASLQLLSSLEERRHIVLAVVSL